MYFPKYSYTLCIILILSLLFTIASSYNNEGNKNFNETENAAKAIRKLLNGEIDTIKLENGDELKIKSSNNIQEDYSWKNNNRQL
ncbi:conserved Plasmodium protein, unknown function [Plasmodium yoelii]|uniref:PIMMS1 protein n=2 Tax=Plasmodium yoelii TaxID=5861 RepID=A0AAE9WPF4_PLAYO|nr:conserved Plasmodium protein, unknown function [Plasmodium yoelii]WBY54677.1 PIMMS1 protein [Plasmodium yoelii yoelii]CDU16045.1 conserved Plasmodium protein, unknown function [Plasmodium yoelii]VTZ71669.1 conserved Plasmodium protein, unknown function [Plasmodium yoelii]|eukprot:XP_729211.2 conserved Plasmodium protein, unknown function [Plasmodium yoelii]